MVTARALTLLLLSLAVPTAAPACGTALALGIDVSSSVDAAEARLQTQGVAAAFRNPRVSDAILGSGGIMVAVYEWSGFHRQEVTAGWTWLGDSAAIAAFADRVERQPRRRGHWRTALGRAVDFAVGLHARNPRACARRVIDISGDGANNDGEAPDWYAREGYLDGFTVNGLAIRGARPDPAEYYRDHLIHGPGAFVEVAEGFADFQRAMIRKLVRELQTPMA